MIDISEVKVFLKVDHDDEDALINRMIESAKMAAMDYLNWEEVPIKIPEPVVSAILLMIGDLYENRSLQGVNILHTNKTYERLLNPYRLMTM